MGKGKDGSPGWQWSDDPELRQRVQAERAALGLYPRAPRFGHVRVVGVYDIPLYEDVTALEVLVHKPVWMVDVAEWVPYQPPSYDEEWAIGLADFYLSDDGAELVGSYLQRPPISRYTRMVLLFYEGCHEPVVPGVGRLRLPCPCPLPERLLRLIWIDR